MTWSGWPLSNAANRSTYTATSGSSGTDRSIAFGWPVHVRQAASHRHVRATSARSRDARLAPRPLLVRREHLPAPAGRHRDRRPRVLAGREHRRAREQRAREAARDDRADQRYADVAALAIAA